MKRKILWIIIIISFFCISVMAYYFRSSINDWWINYNLEPVPEAVSFEDVMDAGITEGTETTDDINYNNESTDENSISTNVETNGDILSSNNDSKELSAEIQDLKQVAIEIPDSINLAIPFTSQAPRANWNLPYQEACEEASSLMSARFLQGRSITGPDDADSAILQLVEHGSAMGYPIDTTAEQTAAILEDFYDLDAELVYNFTWDDVKNALALGYPVLMPAAGRQLGNPNFTQPGPLYHMLVIKGYTPNIIITNDPGTRNGAGYQYSYDTLYNAAHDWNGGDVANGQKVIIIVKPN